VRRVKEMGKRAREDDMKQAGRFEVEERAAYDEIQY